MNAQTLTTGFALSASLLFATSALAVNASPDSSVGGPGADHIAAQPDSSLGGQGQHIRAQPDTSIGGSGQLTYDPSRQDDLRTGPSVSLARFMRVFAGQPSSWAYRLFAE